MNHFKTAMALLITCLLGTPQLAMAKTPLIDDPAFANAGNQSIKVMDKGERVYAEGGARCDSPDKGGQRGGNKGDPSRAEGGA